MGNIGINKLSLIFINQVSFSLLFGYSRSWHATDPVKGLLALLSTAEWYFLLHTSNWKWQRISSQAKPVFLSTFNIQNIFHTPGDFSEDFPLLKILKAMRSFKIFQYRIMSYIKSVLWTPHALQLTRDSDLTCRWEVSAPPGEKGNSVLRWNFRCSNDMC